MPISNMNDTADAIREFAATKREQKITTTTRKPYFYCIDPQPPFCEHCGEEQANIKLAEAVLCYDCASIEFRNALELTLGYKPCGQLVWQTTEHDEHGPTNTAICLVPFGTEHCH